MNKTVLVVAFHFPPIAISSGVQRALKVVRYLREDGWRPIVLTVDPRAYAKTHTNQLAEIPADVPVYRAFGLDTTRHLAIRGRYPDFLAWPDPWVSWWPAAVWTGMSIIRRYRPNVIWSTFPITTTNLVTLPLAKSSGLPWIADFRDPMTMDGYPADAVRFRCARWIERKTVALARHVVFTSDYTRKMYEERYPGLAERAVLIPNGYDEGNFPALAGQDRARERARLTLVHSGALQPDGRNPRTFFEALKKLRAAGKIAPPNLRVIFRACGFEEQYEEMARSLGVADIVEFQGYLPYEQALGEMLNANGLLLFQGTAYNHAVPAKLYEYYFARKPIFALLDKSGETQRVLQEAGVESTAGIGDVEEICSRLEQFVLEIRASAYRLPPRRLIEGYSRRAQTKKLSLLLAAAVARS